MSQKSHRRSQIRSWLLQASSEEQILITLVKDHDLTRKQARRELMIVKRNLGRDATHLDILGELMVNYHQRAIQLSQATRKIAEGNQPASLHNTVHHLLVAQKNTILDIAKQRDLEKRNQFKPNDDPELAKDIRIEQAANNFAEQEIMARTGRFYSHAARCWTIQDCLPPEDIAVRDILRMRFLPKSPYEEFILAEEYDAVLKEEADVNKEHLLNYPLEGDWYDYENNIHQVLEDIGDRDAYQRLARRVFIERLRYFNETRETAERKIDAKSEEILAHLRKKHNVRTESKFDQILKANKAKMEKEKAMGIQERRGVSPPVPPTSDTTTSLTPDPDVVSRSPDRDTHPTEGLPNLNPKWRHMLCIPPLQQNDPHWKGSFATVFAPILLALITLWALLNAGLSNLFTSQAQLLTNHISITALSHSVGCHASDCTQSEAFVTSQVSELSFPDSNWKRTTPESPPQIHPPTHSPPAYSVRGSFFPCFRPNLDA